MGFPPCIWHASPFLVRAVMPLPSAFQRYSRPGSFRSGHTACRRAGCTRRRCEMDLGQQFHEVDGP
jgi:hypothetical protein